MLNRPKTSINPPSVEDMKLFASNFTKSEWHKLCADRKFIKMFCESHDYNLKQHCELIINRKIS